MAKFYISKDAKGEYRFLLKAANNEPILAASEGYTSKQNCQNAIESVRINSQIDSRYDRRANSLHYFFTLQAANGQTLGISEMYNTAQGRDNGISAVKRDAPGAPVVDLT